MFLEFLLQIIFFLGRLNTFESAIPSDNMSRDKQEAMGDKSDLNASKFSPTKDVIDKEKDSFKNEDKIGKNTMISEDQRDSTTTMKHILDEENEKLLASEDLKRDGKTAAKKLDDGESNVSRQSNERQTVRKENLDDVQVTSKEKDKVSTKQTSMKMVTKESSEDAEFKDNDLNKRNDIKMQADEKQKMEALTERSTDDDDKYLDDSARGKSADLSSTESRVSMVNMEESFSPERTGSPHDKKLERIKRDNKEKPETGKLSKYITALDISKI